MDVMGTLYWFEKIRNPVLNFIFSAITALGEETAFLVIAILIFWCVDKRRGYFVLVTGFIGTLTNQIMKLAFKIPRPWVIDPNFTVVDGAKTEATGYSFPSGHTQNAVGTFGIVFTETKKNNWVKYLALAAALLVPISRMYLGVHTPLDVVSAACIAVILIIILAPLFESEKNFDKFMPYIVGFVFLLSVGFYVYAMFFNKDITDHNVLSARKNARTFLGCALALIPVYFLDRCLIRFKTKAKWYNQILKLAIGLGIVLLIKSVLKTPLAAICGQEDERILRYFLIVLFAGAIWPLTFPLFDRINIPSLNRYFGAEHFDENMIPAADVAENNSADNMNGEYEIKPFIPDINTFD